MKRRYLPIVLALCACAQPAHEQQTGSTPSADKLSFADAFPKDKIESEGGYLLAAIEIGALENHEAVALRDALAVCSNIGYDAEEKYLLNRCHTEIDRYLLDYDSDRMIDSLLERLKTLDGLITLIYGAALLGGDVSLSDLAKLYSRRHEVQSALTAGFKARQ